MNNPFQVLLQATEKKATHTQPLKFVDQSGEFKIGKPTRPNIEHDGGFLAKFPKRSPTAADYAHLARWYAILNGAELACNDSETIRNNLDRCEGRDLVDGTAAYRHFLEGGGKDRTVNYERYLTQDESGRRLLFDLETAFRAHIEIIGKDRIEFSVTSDAFKVDQAAFGPYPATENWQKAIGAHYVWLSADVTVSVVGKLQIEYNAVVTIHMEDKYNFNPDNKDVKSNRKDEENGRFELSGLGHPYMSYGTVTRNWRWIEGERLNPALKF